MGEDPHRVNPELTEGPAHGKNTQRAAARSPTRTSRRELLVVGAVGATAIYLGLKRKDVTRGNSYRGRVIVVGAGLAGLSAAWELERRGWDVVVLDARQRIGGRCHTLRNFAGGQIAEAGGEFIDTTHREMRRFAAHFGLRLEDLRQGAERYEDLAYVGGKRQTLEQFYGGKTEREIEGFYEQASALLGVSTPPTRPLREPPTTAATSPNSSMSSALQGGRERSLTARSATNTQSRPRSSRFCSS